MSDTLLMGAMAAHAVKLLAAYSVGLGADGRCLETTAGRWAVGGFQFLTTPTGWRMIVHRHTPGRIVSAAWSVSRVQGAYLPVEAALAEVERLFREVDAQPDGALAVLA